MELTFARGTLTDQFREEVDAFYGSVLGSPGFDHLGLLQDSRAEVDDLLEACKRYKDKDDRVQIQEYEDLVYPGLTVHAFYVKYLLPIYFDVQSMERTESD